MSIEARVETLKTKHAKLEDMLAHETSRPLPDPARIHSLKKEKLVVKDEMRRMQS